MDKLFLNSNLASLTHGTPSDSEGDRPIFVGRESGQSPSSFLADPKPGVDASITCISDDPDVPALDVDLSLEGWHRIYAGIDDDTAFRYACKLGQLYS